ncbi:unnamed protein product [Clonostachys rosea f. rosea IK726]|uniref:Pectate lyase superfamily protein domain-containing protein n=2 Tax=Bionectria ochroleuca TaxID=29856 RepID=A0A0B7K4K5_BIOOC|nr:unnamed protein product [Clonostachys rosea f. rosea IK726]
MRLSLLLGLLPITLALDNQALAPVLEPRAVKQSDFDNQTYWEVLAKSQGRSLCYLRTGYGKEDDALKISDALNKKCRKKGMVVFPDKVYHMKSNITTMKLDDVHIHQKGRLRWSTDIDYWLSVSMPIGFQNQSTVWYFGGDKVVWDGYGHGTLDGNGQVWYDWAAGRGNLPHRPMMINFNKFTNSIVRGMRFVQSQMWTMTTTHSKNLVFDNIFVNNTSNSKHSTLNTDGIDTIWSDNITLSRWDVTSGDDNIALKGNSSNIRVLDSIFRGGQGLAIGSLGQYKGQYEHIENFYARNITMLGTKYVIYLKTWPGVQDGYPPNGGGGGLGHGKNIVVEDVTIDTGRGTPFWFQQCEQYQGNQGKDCDSSKFTFSDIYFKNVKGTMRNDGAEKAAYLRCSLAGGCKNVTIENFGVTLKDDKAVLDRFLCSNVKDTHGFKCQDITS